MTLPLIEQLQETFGGGTFTPEKLQGLIQETLKAFQVLHTKIKSQDPKERQEGLKMALELKRALEAQSENLCRSAGMSPTQLAAFVENSENFSQEEWDTLGIAKKELEALKVGLNLSGNENKVLKTAKKKNTKTWLVG
jgi:hypothetical protein